MVLGSTGPEGSLTGISIMDSSPTNKIYPAATDYNRHHGFQRLGTPDSSALGVEEASLTTPENDKAHTCLSLYRFLRNLSVPCQRDKANHGPNPLW